MLRGIVIPTGQLLGDELLRTLEGDGCNGVRVKADIPGTTAAHTWELAREVLDAGMQPYVSIREAEQMTLLPMNVNIGLGNEPNDPINGWTRESYRREADECVAFAKEMGRRIYLGCLANVHREHFDWLSSIWRPEWSDPDHELSQHVASDMHCYPDPKRFGQPPRGFRTWGDVGIAWARVVGGVPKMIGESGCNTLEYSEQQQAHHFQLMGEVWSPWCDWIFAYQLIDGPNPQSTNVLDHYGLKEPAYSAFLGGRS